MLLFGSCGQKHKAAQLADDFVDQYALSPDKMIKRDYCHFDSTKLISDSLVDAMQHRRHPLYKYPIDYPTPSAGRMLYLVRMNYLFDGDTLSQTFYIDEQMEHVVAFK